ncbi:hypothetical protein HY212_04025 [Candidatus Pacearchaeota archaeon]|nr:hypothetical protein [Candidatus Pacearchaeota archaeon]
MAESYKSVEMRVYDLTKPVRKATEEFAEGAIKIFSSFVLTPLRLPTFVRKAVNGQTYADRALKEAYSDSDHEVGHIFGAFAGAMTDFMLGNYIGKEAHLGDYLPLAVLIAANIASGIYEIKRLPKSREEYKSKSKLENFVGERSGTY